MNVEKFRGYLEEKGNLLEKKSSAIDNNVAEEAVDHFRDEIIAYGNELKKKYRKEIDEELDELHQLAIAADLLNSIEGSVIDLEKINRASRKTEEIVQGLAEILGVSFLTPSKDWAEPIKKVLDICKIEYTQSGNYIIIKED